jgi:hypothetical protein
LHAQTTESPKQLGCRATKNISEFRRQLEGGTFKLHTPRCNRQQIPKVNVHDVTVSIQQDVACLKAHETIATSASLQR